MQVQYERVQLLVNFHYQIVFNRNINLKQNQLVNIGLPLKGFQLYFDAREKTSSRKQTICFEKSIFLVLYSGLISLSNEEGHTLAMLSFLSCIVNPPIDVKMS